MTFLHYGTDLRIDIDQDATRVLMENIAAHASRGGWVSVVDREQREWQLLVSAGIPIWINNEE